MSPSSFFWITALASLGSFACSAGDVDPSASETDAVSTTAEDLRAAAPSYVTVRRDLRRCASPLCGGFFVDAVNQDTLRCVDGSRAAECYVFDLDLSSLGLSAEQEATLRGNPDPFLLLGQIRAQRTVAGRLGQLAVTEAWQGHDGITPSGRFFRAHNDGIVCITSPCLSFSAELLNRQDPSFKVAEIDLSGVTDDPSAAFAQLDTADGLLLAGRRTTVTGPAGRARGLSASEFYLPFVAQQQSCGSRGQSQCADGSFCNFPVEAACGSFWTHAVNASSVFGSGRILGFGMSNEPSIAPSPWHVTQSIVVYFESTATNSSFVLGSTTFFMYSCRCSRFMSFHVVGVAGSGLVFVDAPPPQAAAATSRNAMRYMRGPYYEPRTIGREGSVIHPLQLPG